MQLVLTMTYTYYLTVHRNKNKVEVYLYFIFCKAKQSHPCQTRYHFNTRDPAACCPVNLSMLDKSVVIVQSVKAWFEEV